MKRSRIGVLALTLLPFFVGCGDDDPSGPKDPTELEFAVELGVDLNQMTKTSTGLYWQDLVVGEGDEAEAGGFVTVHYTGWLHSGAQFDSSRNGEPVRFNLGSLIQGWQEGIPGMKVGGQRLLVVPPSLGYGAGGVGTIPGNATLVFDIELMGVG